MRQAAKAIRLTDEQAALVEANQGLIWAAARKFHAKWKRDCNGLGLDVKELYGVGLEAFVKCAGKFDPSLSAISTFLSMVCHRACAGEMNRRRRRNVMGVFPAGLLDRDDGLIYCTTGNVPDPSHRMETSELVTLALEALDPRERQILRQRADGNTFRSIGESLGLTKQRIHQIMKHVKEKSCQRLDLADSLS